jgi:hypothetical protein
MGGRNEIRLLIRIDTKRYAKLVDRMVDNYIRIQFYVTS